MNPDKQGQVHPPKGETDHARSGHFPFFYKVMRDDELCVYWQ